MMIALEFAGRGAPERSSLVFGGYLRNVLECYTIPEVARDAEFGDIGGSFWLVKRVLGVLLRKLKDAQI